MHFWTYISDFSGKFPFVPCVPFTFQLVKIQTMVDDVIISISKKNELDSAVQRTDNAQSSG